MSKNRFPKQRKSKLNSCGDGHFRVIKRVNNKACRIELPCEYDVNVTLDMSNLTPFVGGMDKDEDEDPIDLRSNPSQKGEDNGKP